MRHELAPADRQHDERGDDAERPRAEESPGVAPRRRPQRPGRVGSEGRADEDSALAVAESLGVGKDKIRAEMAKSPGTESVQETYQLAQNLGITGTPSYVIGNELVQGAVGFDDLEAKVKNMRACGKTAC